MADLIRRVIEEEIKSAIFRMPLDKAPGPDGYNAFFFQRMWNIVGPDVVSAIQYFCNSSRILKQFNHASITLIPKGPNPSKLREFRPISCCNVFYKCISNILANRKKALLPNLIDTAQSAFVKGRSISDNILIAQELMRNYHRHIA